MSDNSRDVKYEQLYTQLLERGETLHENNKKRIRRGLIMLVILPFILGLILWITDSSRIVFLIIWILCMFAISAYLISVEYLDDSIQKTLEDVTNSEADFDQLLPHASRAELHERIRERISERRAQRAIDEAARIEAEAGDIAARLALQAQEEKDAEKLEAELKAAELLEAEAAFAEVKELLGDASSDLEAEEELEAIMAAGRGGKEDGK